MHRHDPVPIDGGSVSVVFTDRDDGDFRPLPADGPLWTGAAADAHHQALTALRNEVVAGPWSWLRQVHGARVVLVTSPGDLAGAQADGAATTATGCPLTVTTADCAPVILIAEGGVAVVHAGWRGLMAGVIANAASQLRAVAGTPVDTLLGPCISAGAYEFGADQLAVAADRFGAEVESTTTWGTPALDVPRAVAVACEQVGWPAPGLAPPCTSEPAWFSHRVRQDPGRQATVAWITPEPGRGAG